MFSLAAIAALGETGERIAAKQADHVRAERHVLRGPMRFTFPDRYPPS
jgi:hypothetical protein